MTTAPQGTLPVAATHIGLGFSKETSTSLAAREAALEAKAQIQVRQIPIDLALVFATHHYSHLEALNIVHQVLNPAKIFGCSTVEIILSQGSEKRGISVLAMASQDIKFGMGFVGEANAQNDLRLAGATLARNTLANLGNNQRQGLIILADSSLENYSHVLQGMQEVFGHIFPIIGAVSNKDAPTKENYQYFQGKLLTHSAIALLVGNHAHIGTGSYHGWKPLGKPRFVTKSENHIIRTIDGKRASEIYEAYLGLNFSDLHTLPLTKEMMLYPLGIYNEGQKEYLLRNALKVLEDGSILCQADVPENSEIHVMISNKECCREAAVDAAREVKKSLLGKEPKLILLFESLARKQLLGRESMTQIREIREVLGINVPILGIYTQGEMAPLKSGENIIKSEFQNNSIVLLGLT